MDIIHITEQTIEKDAVFNVQILQSIAIDISLAQTNLSRENYDLNIVFPTGRKLLLQNFFIGEDFGIYPKIIFPTGENFSGYAFIGLLEPSFLKKGLIEGKREAPAGTIIEHLKMKREYERDDAWHIENSLYIPPQSTQRESIVFPAVEDDNVPAFYKEIQQAFFSPQKTYEDSVPKENLEENLYQETNSEESTDNKNQEENEYYDEEENLEYIDETEDVKEEQRYTTGYVLTQENIDNGYSITEINRDPSLLETMVPGQYGFLTMTYYGGFNYVLGEGIEVDEGNPIEDYFAYTIETDYGDIFDGGMYVYIFKKDNRTIFEYSASEIE